MAMQAQDLAKSLIETITGWATQHSDQYILENIPKERVDIEYNDSPLSAYRGYLRVWMVEMYLTKKRRWFADWFPAVHTSVQLKFGDREKIQLSHVAQAPEEALANGVLLNYPTTPLLPFNGGVVEIEAALLALKGADYLNAAIGVLQSFSGLISPPLAQVLNIAGEVAAGLQNLLGATDGQVHLGMHQAFNADGGGNPLKAGYFAVILSTAHDISTDDLSIKKDRLLYKGEPFDSHDYMLFRIETREERDDWRLSTIQVPLDKAVEAYLTDDTAKAESFKQMAIIAAMQSPDLAHYDRRRVVAAIKQDFAELSSDAKFGEIVERTMSIEAAAAKPKLTYAEAFGG